MLKFFSHYLFGFLEEALGWRRFQAISQSTAISLDQIILGMQDLHGAYDYYFVGYHMDFSPGWGTRALFTDFLGTPFYDSCEAYLLCSLGLLLQSSFLLLTYETPSCVCNSLL